TSVSSISHKWYCLVVTDDFFRFTWTFFLRTRTPQQNGVAKRRNRTLIEAARTMLADAKLPVTFWAEAVNAACYVQNRVLVNKSQNKTPYELFNGRTPAIGFLRPFGCHVMILNTLDNLGKFEPKGDEGYFTRYSMSSKAFMVFNKRNRRVEENLHVELLENKAIEKGAHDALLESSSSKPHDESSTKVPEGSGNPNSTASSSNPPADQIETLTVESLIPTVSSPVPTAYLNDSPEPFSEARLISKRVDNQEETPSLDNILLMTNRLEDILGVTTSSDEAIIVEADVSNMETTILASPTPTLRIHKDHPKSQIIGHVDTPIQTRHKSKEKVWTLVDYPKGVRPIGTKWVLKNTKDERRIVVRNKARLVAQGHTQEEGIDYDEVFAQIKAIRLFLAYVSFMGFTMYQMDVKSAFLYGTINEEVYVMQPPGFQDLAPIGTKWVLKNKRDERGIVVRHKARLVAQGHTQEEGIDYDEVFSPVARIEAIRLFLAYSSFMGFTVYQMDVKSAFLYGTIDEEVYVMQPSGFQDPAFLAKVYKVEKAIYGLHQAPRAWYGTLSKYLLKNGFQRGTIDQTLFIRRQREDFILVQVYVNDIIFGSSNP
nr:hypothetical protein [Tanacetum cinerariifolium]